MQHHKYSLSELEGMIPWERTIYVNMLSAFVKEENDKMEQEKSRIKNNKR